MTEPAQAPDPYAGLTPEQKNIVILDQRMSNLEDYIRNKLGDEIANSLKPVLSGFKARVDTIETFLKQNPSGGGEGKGTLLDSILNVVGKGMDMYNKGGGGAGNAFVKEVEGTMQDIIKLDLKDMLLTRRRALGLPVKTVVEETVRHVPIPQT